MNEENKYFVKFVPFNKSTISMLMNQQIKFSTVYEFNDLNEYHYIAPNIDMAKYFEKSCEEKFIQIIKQYCSNSQLKQMSVEYLKSCGINGNDLKKISSCVRNNSFCLQDKFFKKYSRALLQDIAFSSVGIFPMSNIQIFKDDAAQLMFAHYANSLKGLALIYQIDIEHQSYAINYIPPNNLKPGVVSNPTLLLNWHEGDFDINDMDSFKNKSNKWKYEREYRLFAKPGLKKILDLGFGFKLRAIIYTSRFIEQDIKILKKIQESGGRNDIALLPVRHNCGEYFFQPESETSNNIYAFLIDKLKIKRNSHKYKTNYKKLYEELFELIDVSFNNDTPLYKEEFKCRVNIISNFYENIINNPYYKDPYEYKLKKVYRNIVGIKIFIDNNNFSKVEFSLEPAGKDAIIDANLKIKCFPVCDGIDAIDVEGLTKSLDDAIKYTKDAGKDNNNKTDCLLIIFPKINYSKIKKGNIESVCQDFIVSHESELYSYWQNIYFISLDGFYYCHRASFIFKKDVLLSTPSVDEMSDFLDLVGKSRSLHKPWVYPPSDEKEYKAYISKINSGLHKGFFIKNNNRKIVGCININEITRGCFQSGYLGFYAFLGLNGCGLMTAGLSLVLSYAFNELKLHRLEANIQPDNKKSISFIKSHNFRHEGFSMKYLKINDKWTDHERFAITADDYKN